MNLDNRSRSLDALMTYNRLRIDQFKGSAFSRMVAEGELNDPAKREMSRAGIQPFSLHCQTIMLTRQALCTDPRFSVPFRAHFREEIDHDVMMTSRPGSRETDDAPFIALSSWFSSQMVVLDNVEKAALVHLVLEEAGDHFHHLASVALAKAVPTGYFEQHAELDPAHASMGAAMLDGETPQTYARLHSVIDLGWRMLDAAADRVVVLVRQ